MNRTNRRSLAKKETNIALKCIQQLGYESLNDFMTLIDFTLGAVETQNAEILKIVPKLRAHVQSLILTLDSNEPNDQKSIIEKS